MIRRSLLVVVSLLVLGIGSTALFGASDIIINIYEPGTAKVKIGVPPFVRDPGASSLVPLEIGEEFASVIRDDLNFTGLFEVYASVPPAAGGTSAGSPFAPFKAWVPLGVQSVVQGTCRGVGGKLRFECALFDVESGTRIVGRYYDGSTETARQNAHRFADEIVYRYTGKHGIAHTSISFVKGIGGKKELYIMDYDGRNSYRLTNDNSIALSPDWSPGGEKIAFTSYRDRNPDVYIVDLGKRSIKRVSGFIGLNTTPAFSPDGKTLALTLSKDGNPELYLMELKNGELTRLTRNKAIDTSPTWSPNGRELAFVSDRSGSPQIYVTDREGVNLRRLTYSGNYNTSPVWSPAGDRIAYVSLIGGRGDIFSISPTGGGSARLTSDGGNEDPCWSPDGRFLAFSSSRGGVRDIYLIRIDGSGRRRVTFGGGDNMSPAWSP
jgi:TolB protein